MGVLRRIAGYIRDRIGSGGHSPLEEFQHFIFFYILLFLNLVLCLVAGYYLIQDTVVAPILLLLGVSVVFNILLLFFAKTWVIYVFSFLSAVLLSYYIYETNNYTGLYFFGLLIFFLTLTETLLSGVIAIAAATSCIVLLLHFKAEIPQPVLAGSILFSLVLFGCALILHKFLLEAMNQLLDHRRQALQQTKMSSLGSLAAGVAHELNNPLQIISLLIEEHALELRDGGFNFERQSEIKNQIERASFIIRQLQLFTTGSDEGVWRRISIEELITKPLELMQKLFAKDSISIEFHSDRSPAPLLVVRSKIEQVFINVLTNARDAIMHSEAKERKVSIELSTGNLFSHCYVYDSGPGVDPKLQQKIFQPFFTTKSKGRGMGLGLSLSQSIIQEHNGLLEYFENEKGHGFCFKLPVQ